MSMLRNFISRALATLFVLGVGTSTAMAEASYKWGFLPEALSPEAEKIDNLFMFILIVTTITFIGTEGALLWFIFKYRRRDGVKAYHTHGSHKLEVIWTIIPAVILAIIAVTQFQTWTDLKDPAKFPLDDEDAFEVHVLAKQYEWQFRYAGPDRKWATDDDYTAKQLIIPENRPVIVRLRSLDVIHSLYLREARFKQDCVPGLTITGWFRYNKPGTYEIVCAELCGESHYTMGAQLEVVPTDEWEAKQRELVENNAPVDYESPTEFFRFWDIEDLKED